MLLVLLALAGAVLLGVGIWYERKDGDSDAPWVGIVVGIVLLLTTLGIGIGMPTGFGVQIAEQEAFYDFNTANYLVAVDKTAAYLSQEEFESTLIQGSVERWKQAGYVSERIREWRDSVNRYNQNLARLRSLDRNIWFGLVIPNVPDRLQFIAIK